MRAFQADSVPHPKLLPSVIERIRSQDLDVEIGAGSGFHAVRYCSQNPERTLLAIERTHTRFAGLSQRSENHPAINNLIPVQADAVSVFTHVVRDQTVQRCFLLYPNPYPKAKHANLRWHNMPFVSVLKSKLKRGGELVLATNIKPYADEAVLQLTTQWDLKLTSYDKVGETSTARTHFEKKYLERGESCWNLTFLR